MEANPILIGILVTIIVGWAAWISVFAISTNQKANKSLSNDEANKNEISQIGVRFDETAKSLKTSFQHLENTVKADFKETNHRLDTFIKQEFDWMKSIAESIAKK